MNPKQVGKQSAVQADPGGEAYLNAIDAVKQISSQLPEAQAARRLTEIAAVINEALIAYLKSNVEPASKDPEGPSYRTVAVFDLAETSTNLAKEVLAYINRTPGRYEGMLGGSLEWPAVVSLDPSLDIRKAIANPQGPAAQIYAPVLRSLGSTTMFSSSKVRTPNIFHRLANQAAELITSSSLRMTVYDRLQGLPWWLDYVDESGIYTLRNSWPDEADKRQYALAIKYLLYLTLSPEPDRSRIRESWQRARLEAFKAFRPASQTEERLYITCLEKTPQDVSVKLLSWSANELSLPAIRSEIIAKVSYREPVWFRWWSDNLLYKPEFLFGNLPPLNEWSDPTVKDLFARTKNKSQPMTFFGSRVSDVIDAFLSLCGADKEYRASGMRLPKIRANGFAFEEKLREQEEAVLPKYPG